MVIEIANAGRSTAPPSTRYPSRRRLIGHISVSKGSARSWTLLYIEHVHHFIRGGPNASRDTRYRSKHIAIVAPAYAKNKQGHVVSRSEEELTEVAAHLSLNLN